MTKKTILQPDRMVFLVLYVKCMMDVFNGEQLDVLFMKPVINQYA